MLWCPGPPLSPARTSSPASPLSRPSMAEPVGDLQPWFMARVRGLYPHLPGTRPPCTQQYTRPPCWYLSRPPSLSPVGGYQGLSQSPGYGVGGVTTVWPDAGPWLGGLCGSPRLSVGSSSSLNQHQLLSPMYQPSVGLYQQSSPIGSPAFCFHCLQYGSVYTISKV